MVDIGDHQLDVGVRGPLHDARPEITTHSSRPERGPSGLEAIVFDLDDTLFDHTGSAETAVRWWLAELGITPTDELVADWFTIERRNFDAWLAGTTTHQGQRRARLREFFPLLGLAVPPDDAGLDVAYGAYLQGYERSWIAFPDARRAVEVAHGNGWRVGVLTNGSTCQQNAKLRRIGLAELVDVVCTSESLGYGKPAPEAYRLTCEALDVEPAQTLMIGDNLELDVMAARAAGLTALHLDRTAGTTLTDLVRRTD